jgi:hypothetical protein
MTNVQVRSMVRSDRRDQSTAFTYLGYLGKRQIEQWRQRNVLESETEHCVLQKRTEKNA